MNVTFSTYTKHFVQHHIKRETDSMCIIPIFVKIGYLFNTILSSASFPRRRESSRSIGNKNRTAFLLNCVRPFLDSYLRKNDVLRLSVAALVLIMLIFTLSPLPIHAQASVTARNSHDTSLAISVMSVRQSLKKNRNIILIDVRPKKAYAKYRIPNTLHSDLYAVKTLSFLKEKTIVLVDKGYAYRQLEEACHELSQSGFNAYILDGGLAAWKNRGGELEGDIFAQKDIYKVTAREVFRERQYAGNRIIDISKNQHPETKALLPNSIHLPDVSPETLRKNGISEKQAPFTSIVVLNEEGNGDLQMEKMSAKMTIFFLEGGMSAYRKYLNRLHLSHAPKENRLKYAGSCSPCREAASKE